MTGPGDIINPPVLINGSLCMCVCETNPLLLELPYSEEGHTRRIRHRDSDVVDSRSLKFLALTVAQGVKMSVCVTFFERDL